MNNTNEAFLRRCFDEIDGMPFTVDNVFSVILIDYTQHCPALHLYCKDQCLKSADVIPLT